MNKRQKRKRAKIAYERYKYFNNISMQDLIYVGRRNGKTLNNKLIIKVCIDKKHRPFKELKNIFETEISRRLSES